MEKIRKNNIPIIVGVILLLAAFLRLYNISQYMTFLGDEGRDALVAKEILEGNLTLLGPRASAGDFFTGPVYYYMMAPFLWIFGYNPVGPAVMIALLSVATTYLVYRFGREWFGVRAGVFAAALYAVSPLVIAYSRSSWNPNPMPFFSLLILYLLYKGVKKYSWKIFTLAGFLYGIAFQLHYIEVFLGAVIFFFLLLGHVFTHKKTDTKMLLISRQEVLAFLRKITKRYVLFSGGFLIGFSPFLAFEAKHGFPNTKTIFSFIFSHNVTAKYEGGNATFMAIIEDVFFRLFGRLVTRFPSPQLQDLFSPQSLQVWHILTLILAIISIIILIKHKNKLVVLLFSLWLFFGIILFGFYKKPIHDYYFEFMFPLPFLLIGNALGEGLSGVLKKRWAIWAGTGIFLFLLVLNLLDMPFRYPPNNQKQQAETIANFVLSKTDNQPFNFALLTKGNSDHAYRYFFHIKGKDPVSMNNTMSDPKRTSVTDQLLVICDYPDCQPLGNSLFEVAGFGRADIAGTWDVAGVKVYRLVHYRGSDS